MKSVKLFFPGRFEEAFVYMDRLTAITEEHTLQVIDLRQAVMRLQERYISLDPVLNIALLKSNFDGGMKLKFFLNDIEAFREVHQALERFEDSWIEVDTAISRPQNHELRFSASVLLDMHVYWRRIYFATDQGLFHVDADWEPRELELRSTPRKRSETRCLQINVKYATVTASCGDEGLFAAPDDFAWAGTSANSGELRHLAEHSWRSSWLTYTLVNYPHVRSSPSLFPARHQRVQTESQELTVVTGFDPQQEAPRFISAMLEERGLKIDDIKQVFNSRDAFFIQTFGGALIVMELKQWSKNQESGPQLRSVSEYSGLTGRILDAYPTRSGIVLETDFSVLFFADGQLYPLVEDEVISVKTFPSSKRLQDVVAITMDEGILLVGLFQDLAPSEEPPMDQDLPF